MVRIWSRIKILKVVENIIEEENLISNQSFCFYVLAKQ